MKVMKKNVLASLAFVLTIILSAFIIKPFAYKYGVYMSGTENAKSSFMLVTGQPFHERTTPFDIRLNWFRIEAGPDGIVSDAEFNNSYELYDVVSDSSNLLKDEIDDIEGELDLFNK